MEKPFIIYIGTFDNDDQSFSWDKFKEFDTISQASKAYKDLISSCAKLSYDELLDKYSSSRLDIELRQDKNMLKWFGIYEKPVEKSDN